MGGGYDGPSRVAWRIVGSEDMVGGGVRWSAWQPMASGVFTKCFSFRRASAVLPTSVSCLL